MDALIAMAEGAETVANANASSQITTAYWLVTLMMCSLPLTESYSDVLSADQLTYFTDSLQISTDPNKAALAAADYQKYQMDSSEMDLATGKLNNLIETSKGVVRSLGQSMNNIYGLEQPIALLQKGVVQTILSFFK